MKIGVIRKEIQATIDLGYARCEAVDYYAATHQPIPKHEIGGVRAVRVGKAQAVKKVGRVVELTTGFFNALTF